MSRLEHVTAHGIPYGVMRRDYAITKAVLQGITQGMPVFGMAGTNLERTANDLDIPLWAEMYGEAK